MMPISLQLISSTPESMHNCGKYFLSENFLYIAIGLSESATQLLLRAKVSTYLPVWGS